MLSHAELAARHGAHPNDIALVRVFARDASLSVVRVDRLSRTIVLAGDAGRMRSALGVARGATGRRIKIPKALCPVVLHIFGLDDREAAKPHVQASPPFAGGVPPDLAHYTVTQVARWYRFPPRVDGRGQTIALLELGGGFRRADLNAYFRRLRLRTPRIAVVSVHGARNRPVGGIMTADTEVCLDIEVAGAAAPGARLVMYFAPNTHRGFVDGVKAAVYDRRHRPQVISISWGNAEPTWDRRAMRAIEDALEDAAALGITVCTSSGDLGPNDGLKHRAVEYPASSPNTLSCGGTRLIVKDGAPHETPWNDLAEGWGAAGGGNSVVFSRPAYQRDRRRAPPKGRGRAVPDVAGNADPETGYVMRVNGHWIRMAGTSAVAPLWAGLLARCIQSLRHRLGPVNDALYHAAGGVTPVRPSRARGRTRRWNPFTGLGTPDGVRLLALLRARSAGGVDR